MELLRRPITIETSGCCCCHLLEMPQSPGCATSRQQRRRSCTSSPFLTSALGPLRQAEGSALPGSMDGPSGAEQSEVPVVVGTVGSRYSTDAEDLPTQPADFRWTVAHREATLLHCLLSIAGGAQHALNSRVPTAANNHLRTAMHQEADEKY